MQNVSTEGKKNEIIVAVKRRVNEKTKISE